jgi:hypothetical protein
MFIEVQKIFHQTKEFIRSISKSLIYITLLYNACLYFLKSSLCGLMGCMTKCLEEPTEECIMFSMLHGVMVDWALYDNRALLGGA